MRRSPPPKRQTPMPRSGRVRPRNHVRRDEKHARNFGEEAERVRAMTCVAARPSAWQTTISQDAQWILAGRTECSGDNVVMHVESRGSGGGRLDAVCACARHHDEQHLIGIKSFAARYGLDLRAEADRIALEHPRPLGLRALADRWSLGVTLATIICGDRLDAYETDALLGWVRREMAREAERRVRRVREEFDVWKAADREALSYHIEQTMGGCFASDPGRPIGLAWSLCEAAGWPS